MSGFDHCVTGKRGYHFSTATMLDGAAVSIEKLRSSSGGEPQLMCFVCACSLHLIGDMQDKEKAHAHLEQECKELEEKVAFHAHLEQECKELEEKVAFHAHLEQECKELEEKVAIHAHLEQECKELEEKVALLQVTAS